MGDPELVSLCDLNPRQHLFVPRPLMRRLFFGDSHEPFFYIRKYIGGNM